MPEPLRLPKLYAILDVACFALPLRTTAAIVDYARDLATGGVTWLQYRNKVGHTREMLSHAREIRRVLGDGVTLMMNDRADICIAADYEGVHVGQDDLSAEGARTVIGPSRILGVSTHNLEQLQEADAAGGLHRLWPGVRYLLEAASRSHRWSGRLSRRAGCDEETAGGDRRHHSRQRAFGSGCGGRLRRRYLRLAQFSDQSC